MHWTKARSLRAVERWYKQFERGDFNLEDDPRSGRPRDVTTPETVAAIEKPVRWNRRIIYKQIEENLTISAWTVNKIIHEHLHLRKVCTLFVPHKLTDEQKANRVEWCKGCLYSIYSNVYPCGFLHLSFPTMLPSYFHLQLSYFQNFSSIIFHFHISYIPHLPSSW